VVWERALTIENSRIRYKPNSFALSLSKGVITNKGFDKRSPNGEMVLGKFNQGYSQTSAIDWSEQAATPGGFGSQVERLARHSKRVYR
jgi:hypothetical protein